MYLKDITIKYALLAVVVSLFFGILTSLLSERISQKDPVFGYGSDSNIYWDLAGNLAKGRGFVNSPGFDFAYIKKTDQYTYGTQRLPGYPLALAGVRYITQTNNPNSLAVWLFNLILVFFNAYFIISLIKKLLPNIPNGWYWIVALFPPFLIYSNGINSDFFVAVLLSGFCYFILSSEKRTWLSLLFAGSAVFTRANAIFFIIPFLALSIFFSQERKKKFLMYFSGILLVILIFCVWSFRNQKLSGSFTYVPFTGQQLEQNYIRKIYKYNRPSGEEKYFRWEQRNFVLPYFDQLVQRHGLYKAEVEMNSEITKDTVSLLMQKKITAVKIYSKNVAQMFTNEYFIFNLGRTLHHPFVWAGVWLMAVLLYFLPGILLLWLGAMSLWKRKVDFFAILTYSSIIYILVTAAILGDFARYVLPIGFAIVMTVLYFLGIIRSILKRE